jgi:hypothetical protein
MAVLWDVAPDSLADVDRRSRGAYCFNIRTMKVVCTSETSVNIYETTWCNIPEDSHLHKLC